MYNKNIELGFKKGNKGNKKSQSLMTPGFLLLQYQIGATGFEPATSRPPAERATKLRHTPKLNHSCTLSNFQLTYTAIC